MTLDETAKTLDEAGPADFYTVHKIACLLFRIAKAADDYYYDYSELESALALLEEYQP